MTVKETTRASALGRCVASITLTMVVRTVAPEGMPRGLNVTSSKWTPGIAPGRSCTVRRPGLDMLPVLVEVLRDQPAAVRAVAEMVLHSVLGTTTTGIAKPVL